MSRTTDLERRSTARHAFRQVVQTMGRRRGMGAPVRDSFFNWRTDQDTVHYPMARLMSSRGGAAGGGRGGRTRILLYLSLLWVAGSGDHSSTRPARFWAELLGFDDPSGAGARAVRSSWHELAARRMLRIEPSAGDEPPTVYPLREDGTGEPYSIPSGIEGNTYRRVPERCWELLFFEQDLTGAGLVMYLVALRTAERARTVSQLTFPISYIRHEYGIGESTIRNGLANLCELNVLERDRVLADNFGDRINRARRRYVYDLLPVLGPDFDRLRQAGGRE